MSHLNEERVFHKEKIPLQEKYKIPLNHFEYDYIETCNDAKHLERIVTVLRSGEEGYFPDLIKFAEKRLNIVKPQSKLLLKLSPIINKDNLSKEEQKDLKNDLTQWLDDVQKDDKELTSYKSIKNGISAEHPEIRKYHTIKSNVIRDKTEKRIAATDYSAWDKYDPDTEILKMDLEEDKLRSSIKPAKGPNDLKSDFTYLNKNENQKKNSKTMKKTVQFNDFLTTAEALKQANQEKDKGNECFKIGEYNEAFKHYTNSVNHQPILGSYTNRALVNIKLNKYEDAIDDCNSALKIEPCNIKALLRKAQALELLKNFAEALHIAEYIITIDPNHATAQQLAEKARKQIGAPVRRTRLTIKDVEANGNDDDVVIPIPGSSKMTPPYYVKCSKENLKQVERQIVNNNHLMHIVSVDLSDADDDDLESNSNETKFINKEEVNNDNKKEIKPTMTKDRHETGDHSDNDLLYVHSPYNFLKMWNSAHSDGSLVEHANILGKVDVNRIGEVIGCKLDSAMFSKIIKCLSLHLAVPKHIDRLHSLFKNIVDLPRFSVIQLMMSQEDRSYLNILIDFLKQHDKSLPDEVCNKLLN